ncbi:hypothetical protein [Actinomycetospora termitidis]|uniref:Uncharacterized protein n=1 Tax=Actinomycetospora termitidis TaxID=3053470 RepID=A0ABT7MHZ5_9PSEU|nr:hypothetical protein [Actinomycetospora sp. Odt1-22]MDL5159512.1 hypothetical protein [Actinomycetospora sp. Odt1-22]
MGIKDAITRVGKKLQGEDGPLDPPVAGEPSEQDVATDPRVASSRATGGVHQDDETSWDEMSVTGTGDTDEFVGRVAGDDPAYAEETGAEARRAQE